jgi:transposase-like protein
MVAAAVRMVFIQPDQATARSQLHRVAATLERRYPKAAE